MPSLFSLQVELARAPRSATELARAGVTRSKTAGAGWRRAARGYYLAADQPRTTAQKIVDASVCLSAGGAIAGWAAAFVGGVDWLDGIGLDGAELAVPLCLGPHLHRRSTRALRYSRDRLPADHMMRRDGLSVTAPLRTAVDTARWADSVTEAVVALDALAHFALIRLADVDTYLAGHAGWAGVRQVRRALPLTDARVRSPWESRLRMAYVLEAGLPRPLVNPPVFDDRGNFIGMPDLLDPEAGLAIEFDGSDHRDRLQHNRDNAREEALEAVGLVVVRADSYDYRYQRRRLIERMISGHRRGTLRARRLDRWTLQTPAWAMDPYASLSDEDKEAMFGHR